MNSNKDCNDNIMIGIRPQYMCSHHSVVSLNVLPTPLSDCLHVRCSSLSIVEAALLPCEVSFFFQKEYHNLMVYFYNDHHTAAKLYFTIMVTFWATVPMRAEWEGGMQAIQSTNEWMCYGLSYQRTSSLPWSPGLPGKCLSGNWPRALG